MADPQSLSILLKRKAELEEAREDSDDWTGKTDPKQRRKLQNRLHQRAWRRRKAGEDGGARNRRSEESLGMIVGDRGNDPVESAFARAVAAFTAEVQRIGDATPNSTTNPPVNPISRPEIFPTNALIPTSTFTPNYRPPVITFQPKSNPLIPPVLPYRTVDVSLAKAPAFVFPISPDHYLLTPVQYNVLRAVIMNLNLCGLLTTFPHECQAALSIPTTPPPTIIPPSFAPTQTQTLISHHSWIDTVPCPQLRDNLILHQGRWDEDELCEDMRGGLYEGYDDTVQKGLLVWDEPWRVGSCEVSEGFVGKWGWLLKRCAEMMRSTNFWREGRGEERLVFEIE